jgi:metallophosphoesterase superfamily enzyme
LTNWRAAARLLARPRDKRRCRARLEQLEEALAGDAALLLGDLEHAAELTLEQAVDVTELLLFVEADGVFGNFAAHLRAVLPGG